MTSARCLPWHPSFCFLSPPSLSCFSPASRTDPFDCLCARARGAPESGNRPRPRWARLAIPGKEQRLRGQGRACQDHKRRDGERRARFPLLLLQLGRNLTLILVFFHPPQWSTIFHPFLQPTGNGPASLVVSAFAPLPIAAVLELRVLPEPVPRKQPIFERSQEEQENNQRQQMQLQLQHQDASATGNLPRGVRELSLVPAREDDSLKSVVKSASEPSQHAPQTRADTRAVSSFLQPLEVSRRAFGRDYSPSKDRHQPHHHFLRHPGVGRPFFLSLLPTVQPRLLLVLTLILRPSFPARYASGRLALAELLARSLSRSRPPGPHIGRGDADVKHQLGVGLACDERLGGEGHTFAAICYCYAGYRAVC